MNAQAKETAASEVFDFAALDTVAASEQPFEFEVKHPLTDEGLGVFVSVLGMESGAFQSHVRREGNQARKRRKEAEIKGRDDEPVTIEDEEETLLRALAVCIVSWRTVIDGKSEPAIFIGGERLDCTPGNALMWLKRFAWVRAQVNAAAADVANFIGR